MTRALLAGFVMVVAGAHALYKKWSLKAGWDEGWWFGSLYYQLAPGIDADQNISDVVHYHLALLLTRYGQYEESMKALAMFSQHGLDQPDYVEAMGIAALRKPLLSSKLPPGERELGTTFSS